jgi:hypothetical protein
MLYLIRIDSTQLPTQLCAVISVGLFRSNFNGKSFHVTQLQSKLAWKFYKLLNEKLQPHYWWWIGKEWWGSSLCQYWGHIVTFAWMDLMLSQKTSVRVVDIPIRIWLSAILSKIASHQTLMFGLSSFYVSTCGCNVDLDRIFFCFSFTFHMFSLPDVCYKISSIFLYSATSLYFYIYVSVVVIQIWRHTKQILYKIHNISNITQSS